MCGELDFIFQFCLNRSVKGQIMRGVWFTCREVFSSWRFEVRIHISTQVFEPPNFFSVIDYQREAPQVISVKSCRVQGRM